MMAILGSTWLVGVVIMTAAVNDARATDSSYRLPFALEVVLVLGWPIVFASFCVARFLEKEKS
jgi:hypothetical protein